MPIVERLRGLDQPAPDIDADDLLERVRNRARRRRQRRVVGALTSIVMVGFGVFVATAGSPDDTELDTAGSIQSVPEDRYLPEAVPEGFTLAWVDVPRGNPRSSPEPQSWSDQSVYSYAIGYRSDGTELEALVYPDHTVDAEVVAGSWTQSEIISNDPGRAVVADGPLGTSPMLVEFDGGAVLVVPHELGSTDGVPIGELLAFGRSFRLVDEAEWRSAVADADVAPPFGARAGETLVTGDGWELDAVRNRAPRSVTTPALSLTFDRPSAADDTGPTYFGVSDDEVVIELTRDGGRTVAWGVAPSTATTVQMWFTERTVTTPAVSFDARTAFAADVGDVDSRPRRIEARDAAGNVLAATVDASQGPCVAEGENSVTVPDVVGMALWEAIRVIDGAGLTVIGTGTANNGDPIDEDAIVTSQAPPSGEPVPTGACVGFRTR